MTAARSTRKRSHNDMEDGDECLPISKRINSLHLEGQSRGLHLQQNHGSNASTFASFCDSIDAASSPLPGGTNLVHSPHQAAAAARQLDLNNDISASLRMPVISEPTDNTLQCHQNTRHALPAPNAHFSRCLSEPFPSCTIPSMQTDPSASLALVPEQSLYRLAGNCDQPPAPHLMHHSANDQYLNHVHYSSLSPYFDPASSSGSVHHTGAVSVQSLSSHTVSTYSLENTSAVSSLQFPGDQTNYLSPFHHAHNQQLASLQNSESKEQQQQVSPIYNSSLLGFQHRQGAISEYTQDFHLQQLPTGRYEPELGVDENPYYFSANQMLYEAHLERVRREHNFPSNS